MPARQTRLLQLSFDSVWWAGNRPATWSLSWGAEFFAPLAPQKQRKNGGFREVRPMKTTRETEKALACSFPRMYRQRFPARVYRKGSVQSAGVTGRLSTSPTTSAGPQGGAPRKIPSLRNWARERGFSSMAGFLSQSPRAVRRRSDPTRTIHPIDERVMRKTAGFPPVRGQCLRVPKGGERPGG